MVLSNPVIDDRGRPWAIVHNLLAGDAQLHRHEERGAWVGTPLAEPVRTAPPYAARSGKSYIGLRIHAEAAHFYGFDPAAQRLHHVADLTEFKGERGQGTRTNSKIHVRMGEDEAKRIYVGDFCKRQPTLTAAPVHPLVRRLHLAVRAARFPDWCMPYGCG